MSKLTLSVDAHVVRAAKRYASTRGTSVSRMVEEYLRMVSGPPPTPTDTPVLRMLRGAARGSSAAVHRRHLQRKYQ